MDHIVTGLTECGDHRVQLAAVRCLHSLSRSVQQLRTTFQALAPFTTLRRIVLFTSLSLHRITLFGSR